MADTYNKYVPKSSISGEKRRKFDWIIRDQIFTFLNE